ncbi:MAG: ferredoxin [Bacteriovoracaceae bacterium]|nr:ferredoxin [Bacteriovoracaceae bacterium]
MANSGAKHSQNVEGAWYCTSPDDDGGEGCIACNVCYGAADDFFGEDDDGNAFVKKQPSSDDEVEACQEQLEACPVAAIGNDG